MSLTVPLEYKMEYGSYLLTNTHTHDSLESKRIVGTMCFHDVREMDCEFRMSDKTEKFAVINVSNFSQQKKERKNEFHSCKVYTHTHTNILYISKVFFVIKQATIDIIILML